MKRYKLFNPYNGEELPTITVHETAKEDFKKLMDWDEKQWNYHTEEIRSETSEQVPTSNEGS